MSMRSILFLALLLVATIGVTAQPVFKEVDGIVRVDVESAEAIGQWVVHNELAGFIGDSYLEFEGANFFNSPGNSTLTYKIRISTTGTYLFRWHSRITEANENTDFNDSWLRCPDAGLVFGERNGSTVFPHGSGMSPVPNGAGSSNWIKAYQNRANEWFWGVFTSDNDPHDIYMKFDNPGDYTIEIAGRSTGHAIDRFVMVHSNALLSSAQDLTQPESERITNSVFATNSTPLLTSPNPVVDFLTLHLPDDLSPAEYQVRIFDLAGKAHGEFRERLGPETSFQIPVDTLSAGTYLVTCEADGKLFLGKFIK